VSDGTTVRLLAPQYRRLTAGWVGVVLLIAFEAMAVATVMPRAVGELGGLTWYAWAFNGYLVPSLFAMVVAGEVCDRRGPRRPLLAGIASFSVGLLVAGCAVDMPMFVLGRALQGLGGGAVLVALYIVVARAYDEALRPRVFAVMSGAWILPSIVGPALAGRVADSFSWRWIFFGVALLVVPTVVAMWPSLPGLDGGQPTTRVGVKRAALLTAVGVALLQYAGQRLDLVGLLLAVIAVAVLARTLRLLLPRGSLRFARGLPASVAMRGVLAGSFFGAEVFVPLMLINLRGLSSTLAGLTLTGGALGWSAGSAFQGRSGLRVSRPALVSIGCLLVAGGIVGIAAVTFAAVPVYVAAIAWVVAGTGMGLAMTSVSVLMLSLSPPADQGANSAALQVSDALFSVVLIGIGGAVLAHAQRTGAPSGATFRTIDAVMCALVLAGAVLARRLAVADSTDPAGLTQADTPA
jgi:MFS family permease